VLHARDYGALDAVNGFTVLLQSATQRERLEQVASFIGEDASGSFGLMRGHARFVTSLVFGMARVGYADGHWEYLALPEAVIYFHRNELTLSTRRYLRGNDYTQISALLRDELVKEEKELAELKQSLEEMERAMLLRLWRSGRGEGALT
jgi:F-type H+-transporting ATPase subunit epsilon